LFTEKLKISVEKGKWRGWKRLEGRGHQTKDHKFTAMPLKTLSCGVKMVDITKQSIFEIEEVGPPGMSKLHSLHDGSRWQTVTSDIFEHLKISLLRKKDMR
jgi:hypothetical protein